MKMVRAAGKRIEEALETAETDVPKHETLLMVVGRGASDPDANSNISKVMRLLWEAFGFGWGEVCYSGVTFPLVEPGLEHATKLGFKRIIVFPYFLFTGVLVSASTTTPTPLRRHPEIQFIKAPYLNAQPLVLETSSIEWSRFREGTGNMNCQMCKYREQVLGFEAEVGLRRKVTTIMSKGLAPTKTMRTTTITGIITVIRTTTHTVITMITIMTMVIILIPMRITL